ncbi:MAG: hypothetical protein ACREJ9_07225 [Candidatus Rokuibacteriota bacterium]
MGRRMAGLTAVSLLFAAGCASGHPVGLSEVPRPAAVVGKPAPAPSPLLNGHAPCLPPGVATDFFTWPVRSFQPIVIPRDDDTVTSGAWVLYGKGDSRVAAVWGGEMLIAVDPNPATNAPIWVDRGLLDDDNRALRSETLSPCQWRRHGERQV